MTVVDDGMGFQKGFGSGVGLANTRARLAALYGDEGRLILNANPRGGVIADDRVAIRNRAPAAGRGCVRPTGNRFRWP